MDTNPLFTAALGLASPWLVTHTDFQAAQRELRLHVDFKKGATFSCPSCKAGGCKVHDTVEKEWRHMDFFQHKAFIIARVPRVGCDRLSTPEQNKATRRSKTRPLGRVAA